MSIADRLGLRRSQTTDTRPPRPPQPQPPTLEALKSSSQSDRQAASRVCHRAVDEKLDATVAALQAQIDAAREKASAEHGVIDALEQETRRQLAADLIVEALATFKPLVTQWRENPQRPVAVQLGAALQQLLAREALEVPASAGTERPLRALGRVFAESIVETMPSAVAGFMTDSPSERFVSAVAAVGRAGNTPSSLFDALSELESAADQIAQGTDGRSISERDAARWRVMRSMDARELAAFDAADQQARQERFERTHRIPDGWELRRASAESESEQSDDERVAEVLAHIS